MQKLQGILVSLILISGVFTSSYYAFAQAELSAEDDFYSIDEDTVLTVVPIGPLLNDTNTDSETFLAVLITDVGFGNLTLGSDGGFTYEPSQNFAGDDSFIYVANNGTDNSNEASVTITVNPVNDPPVAQDDSFETLQNTPILVDVLGNDSDIEDDPLSVLLEVGSNVTKGLVEIQDSEVLYTPPTDFVGTDVFSYMATDGQDTSNSATVTVTINPTEDENEDNNEDSILNEIVTQIQEIIHQILRLNETVMEIQERTTSLEVEVSQLREENSALVLRISELDEIINNNILNVEHDHEDEGEKKILKNEIKALKKEFKEEQKQLKKEFKEEQKQLKKDFKKFLKGLK